MKKTFLIIVFFMAILLVGCETKKEEFIVNFYNGDELLKSELVLKNEDATPPTDPSQEGFIFNGWDQDFTNIVSNLNILAIFEEIIYQVTYYDDFEGEIIKIDNVRHNQFSLPPSNPTKVGFVFDGWSENIKVITSNLDVYPIFIEEIAETYIVIHPKEVTLLNGEEFKFNEWVEFSVEIPLGKELQSVLINNNYVNVNQEVFSFQITKNSTINVIFRDITDDIQIEIIYLNDLHGAILENVDASGNTEIGLAKIANFITEKRKQNPHVIFLSGGDMLQGSALSNYYYGESTIKILNEMGLDFFALGNHEFDWGIDKVTRYFTGHNPIADFPLVAANAFKKGTNELIDGAVPYHILNRGSYKIGIIGYIGQGLESSISAGFVKDYEFNNPYPIVREWASYLRVEEQVDFVIAVGHDGDTYTSRQIGSLSGNNKVDLIYNAHTHQNEIYLNSNMAPIIQAGNNGKMVSHLIINGINGALTIDTNSIINYQYNDSLLFNTADQKIEEVIEYYLAETDQIFKREIIYTNTDISKKQFAQWLAKLMAIKTGADVGTYNYGGVRDAISSGVINLEVLYKVLPFDNYIKSATLKGNHTNTAMSGNPYYINQGVSINNNDYYTVVTNEYVFDYETGPFQLYGTNFHTYEGNIRDWVVEELELQALVYSSFSINNEILSQPNSINIDLSNETRGGQYQIFGNI